MRRRKTILPGLLLVGGMVWLNSVSCSDAGSNEPAAAPVYRYSYRVVESYPHDRGAFTQGLVYEDGVLYEGTGLYGQSALIKRDLKTGRALKTVYLARRFFGEGITVVPDLQQQWGGDRIVQLTWRNHTGFVYRKDTFTLLKQFTYSTEGWGITHDGKQLIYSDGTATLHFLDPNTFAETGRIEVRSDDRPVRGLNELEFVPNNQPLGSGGAAVGARPEGRGTGEEATATRQEQPSPPAPEAPPLSSGLIYANVWPTDQIVMIDPNTGRVTGQLDLSTLYPRPGNSEDVLNGIAWIPETNHLLVTGKLWPKLYEIELVPETPPMQNK